MHNSWFSYVYHDFWHQYGCPQVEDYPLMSTPWPVAALIGFYLFFVKYIGPKLMSFRKPFDLRWPIRVFNAGMVGFNIWGLWNFIPRTNYGFDIWKCPKGCSQTDPFFIWLGWVFFMSRLTELMDTVFFVLRKKYRQVSNLHVFHHSIVPISIWTCFKFVPTIENAIYPYLNCMVHVVMYLYYTLASFGPEIQPYLRWKKYLTAAQLVQFIVIILHSIRAPFIPGCDSNSTAFIIFSIIMGGIFFYLFYNFYLDNYCQKTTKYNRICVNQFNSNECICETCLRIGFDSKTSIDAKNIQQFIS